MSASRPSALPGFLLTFALAAAVFAFFLGDLMLRPNQVAPTFGGDGLTIHYNMQYHANFGDGIWLESQYHPHRESIFLTDAQGVVAVVMSWLRPVFPNIGDYATGISNTLIFWSNPLAAAILFLLFFRLGVRPVLAMLFAVLTAMLSPQVMRQLAGHYALGYAFLFPLLLWYMLGEGTRKLTLRTLGMGLLLILIGLNNPYLLSISAAFLLACAGAALVHTLAGGGPWGRRILHWGALAVGSLGAVFFLLELTNEATDRVAVPFGFFKNVSAWSGLIGSPHTFSFRAIQNFTGWGDPGRESMAYLGLIPLVFIVSLPVLLAVPITRRWLNPGRHPLLVVALFGGLASLAFSFAFPFHYFPDWSYAHLSSVLQFRAPARFVWPLYYVLALIAGYGLARLFDFLYVERRVWAFLLLLPLLGLWGLEATQYLLSNVNDHIHRNALHPDNLRELGGLAERYGIDTERYQGLYLLPTEIAWTDKVHHPGQWRSNHDGYKLSLATGLPLINGKLSRMSLATSLGALELVSNPAVERGLLDELDPTKDILLLASAVDPLSAGERALLYRGELLHADGKRILRRVSVPELRAATDSIRLLAARTTSDTTVHTFLDLEEGGQPAFTGSSAATFDGEPKEIFELPLTADDAGRELEFGFWAYADRRIFGGPKFTLHLRDERGQSLHREQQWSNKSYDTQHGWLRVSYTFTVPPGATRLLVKGEYFTDYVVDAALLRRTAENVVVNVEDERLFNGFSVH